MVYKIVRLDSAQNDGGDKETCPYVMYNIRAESTGQFLRFSAFYIIQFFHDLFMKVRLKTL